MLTFPPLESSDFFGFIAGLPLHPLVVHAAVVLLPPSALVLVVAVFVPSWRTRFGWAIVAGLAAGTAAAFVAKESGEALAAKVGLPADHAFWGDLLVPLSLGLLLVAVGWLVLRNRAARTSSRSLAATVAGGLAVVLALAATTVTVIVGHSGAQAVWAGGVAETPAPTASASASYTIDDVKAHATATDCWSVVDGTVYNLTPWVGQHPGGAQAIVGMCGKDGTAAFTAQHGSQKRPAAALSQYAIGTVSGGKPPASSSAQASSTPTPSSPAALTMAEVKKHASASSCWSVVDGEVYDLTKWINRHPGGARRILDMCGRDASAAFHGQHGSSGRATQILKGYAVGKLG